MSEGNNIRGIWAAVVTPVDESFSPDPRRALPYYKDLLEGGCDGLNVLGTTGEAMSFGADQRMRYMEALASGGLPPARMMAGTGAASLDDAVRLTRCAADCGFAAALVMPPFFFREVSDDGILSFFDALLSRAPLPANGLLLYNFPRMTGITFTADLVDRLVEAFPQRITGLKDSSNDARLQAEIHQRRPELRILPGSEGDLPEAKARGAAGCISGSVALWPRVAQHVFTQNDKAGARQLAHRRAALDGLPLAPAMRYLIASSRNDSEWNRAMPPQRPLSAARVRLLDSLRAHLEKFEVLPPLPSAYAVKSPLSSEQ